MLATQEMPASPGFFKFDRRRSSLGLSSLFADHQVPQFSLDSMLTEAPAPSPGVDHHHHHGSDGGGGGCGDDGAVPSMTGTFFSHESDPSVMLCDIAFADILAADSKPAATAAVTAVVPPTPCTPATPASAAVPMTPVTPDTPRAVLRSGVITELTELAASPPAEAGARGGKRKRCTGADNEASSTTPAPATTASGVHKGSKASTGMSKRARRDAAKCATVLAAMPKPPRRHRGKVSRLDELTKHLSPEKARLEKNRQSAKECRMRKKEYVSNLEKKINEFEQREARRAAEMEQLRRQLAALQQQARRGTR